MTKGSLAKQPWPGPLIWQDETRPRLTVVHVIDQIPRDYRMLITALSAEEIMEIAIKEHTLLLEKYIAPFSEAIRIQPRVVVGREFIEIIKEVLRNNHDLVIKTARGMGGTSGILFGSTAMHLLRKCPCPVWMIKTEQEQRYGRIMAAVDVVPPEVEENSLNNKIMEMATSLARIEKSELHIVHAWDASNAKLFSGAFNYFFDDICTMVDETKKMCARWLDKLLEHNDLQHLQHHEHVVRGQADEIIPELAEQHQVDLIVMGTVNRTGIPGFFIDDTAERILHRIDCSVLTVKPDNFITPVQLDEK